MEHSVLEYVEGFDHEHDMEIPHERGLTVEQKRITIERYDRDGDTPKKVLSRVFNNLQ